MNSKPLAIIITLAYLIANVVTIHDYGLTWDYPHHYNAGIQRLEHFLGWDLSWMPRQDRLTFGGQPYGPIADALPVLFQIIFHYKLALLPADAAYHLPLIFASAVPIYIFFLFLSSRFSLPISIFSTVILATYPRFIGHLHNNPKDTFSAIFFTFAIISLHDWIKQLHTDTFRSISVPGLIKLSFFPSLWTALAFNMKVNAVLIPPILILWLLISYRTELLRRPLLWLLRLGLWFTLTLTLALAIWSLFWPDPLYHLSDLVRHFATGTTGFPIFYFGSLYKANIDVPWHYALGYLTAVTPALVIVFFVIGFMKALKDTVSHKSPASGLLIAWFLVPTLKYIIPGVGILDDIRHFLEVVFPLSAIAGIGAGQLVKSTTSAISKTTLLRQPTQAAANILSLLAGVFRLPSKQLTREEKKTGPNKGWRSAVTEKGVVERSLSIAICIYFIFQTYSLHPYQTSYYSEWLGGLRGVAQKNLFDVEFWGHPLKEGSIYLNQIAPPNSVVWVPMAQQVAKEYLRDDIVVNQSPTTDADYLMVFNRYSMLSTQFGIGRDIYLIIGTKNPLFTIQRQGIPLLWIFTQP